MYCRNRKYFRFRYRVIFVAFLLISATPSSAPEQDSESVIPGLVQCASILSTLRITDPGFSKNPQNDAAIVLGCSIPLTLELMKSATGPSLVAGLFVVSRYLLYESNQLYQRAKDLNKNVGKHQDPEDQFKLLQAEIAIITDFVNKNVETHRRNGNTAKMVQNFVILIGKLISFVNRLRELADHIHKDIKQGSDDKTWSWGYGAGGVIMCLSSFATGSLPLFIPTCSLTVVYWAYQSYTSLEEAHKRSENLQKDIMKMQDEITKTHFTLDALKMRVDKSM